MRYPRLVVYGTLPGFRLISDDAFTCTYTSYLSCYKYPSDLANGARRAGSRTPESGVAEEVASTMHPHRALIEKGIGYVGIKI